MGDDVRVSPVAARGGLLFQSGAKVWKLWDTIARVVIVTTPFQAANIKLTAGEFRHSQKCLLHGVSKSIKKLMAQRMPSSGI
jgi:hypothetical protein